MIGVDRSKMRLYDLEDSAQQAITDSNIDVPVFDRARTESAYDEIKF